MTRGLGVVMAALFLGSLLVPLAVPQQADSEAGPEQAPWWDDGRNVGVDRFREGWNLRIPLEVDDPEGRPQGTPVQAHLDLARSLIEGGWPERNGRPLSFMAYPESVRLVEYDGWGEILTEVPLRQHVTWLEPDQRGSQYEKRQTGPFHGQRNAVVTLEWLLTRDLDPGQTHRFMVYFDIENNAGADQQHRKNAPEFEPSDIERLDSLYWVGAGTSIYGLHEHKQDGRNTLLIIATRDDTTVSVYSHGGGPTPELDVRNEHEPVFHLAMAGDAQPYSFGFQASTSFLVEADRPVIVYSLLGQSGNFVPSRDGGLTGSNFDVPQANNGAYIIRPPWNQGVTRVSVPDGVTLGDCVESDGAIRLADLQYPDGTPQVNFCRVTFQNPQPTTTSPFAVIEGDPVMVQFIPTVNINKPVQIPSVYGSPVGAQFVASTISGQECRGSLTSGFDVMAWGRTYVDIVGRTGPSPHVVHERERIDMDPPEPVFLDGENLRFHQRSCPNPPTPVQRDSLPYTVEVVPDEVGTPTGPVQVRLGGSNPEDQSTPFGGRHGMEFQIQGPFVVHNFYPETKLEAIHRGDGRVETRFSGTPGGPREFNVGTSDVTTLKADKPVSVLPLNEGPARFHAAKPGFLEPDIRPGQYRGYLIETRSADGTDPVFLTGLPDEELVVPFLVRNLAQWDAGPLQDTLPLRDTLRFNAEVESQNWDQAGTVGTDFDHTSMELTDHATHNNRLVIRLPPDVPSETQLTITVQARSEGNEQMTQRFNIIVLVRQTFGVEMWFGDPSSISGPGSKETGIEEDTQEEIPFVIRNTGSNVDSFSLELSEPGGGWDARLTDTAGQPLDRVTDLDPGTQTGAILRLRSPATADVPSVIIPISAVSATSPLASDLITLFADITLEQEMQMHTDARIKSVHPGETQRFEVTLENNGEAGLTIRMGLDAAPPPGWSIQFAGIGHPSQPPISLGPGQKVVIPIDVTAPDSAAADDFVAFLLNAETEGVGQDARAAISLAARVDRSHLLEALPVEALRLNPGETTPFEIQVENQGNTPDAVTIEAVSLPGDWDLTGGNTTHLVDPGETVTVPLNLTIPAHQTPADVALLLQARSQGPAFPFAVSTTVAAVNELRWLEVDPVVVQPGDTRQVALRLENQGNVDERVTLSALAPASWAPRFGLTTFEIPAGAWRTVPLEWTMPAQATGGDPDLRVTARTESGITREVQVPVAVETPRLELEELVVRAIPAGTGQVGTVVVMLHNPGTVPVKNAEARLMGENSEGVNVVVDTVRFASIGDGGTVVAPLRWVEGEQTRVTQIEWGMMRDGEFHHMGETPVPEDEASGSAQEQELPLPHVFVVILLVFAVQWTRKRPPKGDSHE